MSLNRRILLGAAGALIAPLPVRADTGLSGTFTGALQLGPNRLRLKLVLTGDGKATLYSLDQGNAAIPASDVKVEGAHIVLSFAAINARYDATLDGDRLDGTFTQGPVTLSLALKRGETVEADPLAGPLTAGTLHGFRLRAGTPGMAAAWSRTGQTTRLLVDGVRAQGSPAAVAAGDLWHLGSLTKSMTATLMARHVEAGTLSWQTTIGEVLGHAISDMNPAYSDVTLLHLLSHHAGLQPNIDMADLAAFSRAPVADAIADRRAYARLALKQAPAAAPGQAMIYSNNGYVVAAAMLEARMQKPWEALIQEGLFTPLKLMSAGFGPPGADQPSGHIIAADGTRSPTGIDNPVALGPAGRVHMSLGDLVSYLELHRDQPASWLTAQGWQTLHTPPFGGNYALGWIVLPDASLWHNGSNTVWYAEVSVDRAAGTVAAVASNDASGFGGGPGQVLAAARLAAKGG